MFWAEIWKTSEFFIWHFFSFLIVKFSIYSIYLKRRVFIMICIICTYTVIAKWWFWSVCANAQTDLNLRWRTYPKICCLKCQSKSMSNVLWRGFLQQCRPRSVEPCREKKTHQTSGQINLSVRMPGHLARPHVELFSWSFPSAYCLLNEQHRFWRGCAVAQTSLNLCCSHMLS